MNNYEKWNLRVTSIGVTVAIGVLVIYSLQLEAMRQATQAAQEGSAAANNAARLAGLTLLSSKESSLNTLGEMQKQSSAMQNAATAAKSQAATSQKALDASIESSRLDQRAWIGVTEAVPPATMDEFHKPTFIKEGFPVFLGVVITNSGKSPARKAVSLINTILLPKTTEFSPYYGTPEFAKNVKPGIDVIFPGMRMTQTPTPRAPLNAAEVQIIKSGESIFYMYGKIGYEDVFGKPHWTTFCMFLARTGDRFYSCHTYNDAD